LYNIKDSLYRLKKCFASIDHITLTTSVAIDSSINH
jgi:hypothetical protein